MEKKSAKFNEVEVIAPKVSSDINVAANEFVGELKEMTNEIKSVASKSSKEVAEKINFSASVNKVKEASQSINSQLVETTTVLTNNIKEVSSGVAEVVSGSIKEISQKVDLKQNIENVKNMAKSVNSQLVSSVNEMSKEVKVKSKELKTATSKLAKDAVENIRLNDRINALKKVVTDTNSLALETSEELLAGFEKNGVKWNKVAEKAINQGFKMVERNQDLIFGTLENIKTQVTGASDRFKKLLNA